MRSRSTVSFVATSHNPPPIDTLPITTSTTSGQRQRLRIYPYTNREETIIFPQSPATSFPQFLRSLPTHERWIVGHVLPQSPADLHNFLEAVLIGDFGLGSDGSAKGLSTTYSSRIQSRSNLHTFINNYSKSEPTSALRAEAYGYLGCLYLLRAAVTYLLSHGHTIAIPSTNQYMDNLGVLNRLAFGQVSSLKHHLKRNSDVIREIQSVQTSLQFPIYLHHVRSLKTTPLSTCPTYLSQLESTKCATRHAPWHMTARHAAPLPLHQSFFPPKPIFLSMANLRAAKLTSTSDIATKTANSAPISSSAKNGHQPPSNLFTG